MIVKRKKKGEPSKAEHAIHTAALGYLGGHAGSLTAGAISANKQIREVGKIIATDLPNRARAGDERAAKALQGINSNPRAFNLELVKRATTSPRTMEAMKLGKKIGIGSGITLGALNYFKKKRDYDNSKAKNIF